MPPLVGVAIVAAATEFGVETFIAGTVAAALDATTIIGAATTGIIGDIAAGAVVGAAAGVGNAVAAGTDPGNGALWGAATGGATAGLTPGIADVTGLSQDASKAIASGIVTTGSAAAQGAPLDKALEYGATAGAGSYAGSQLVNALTPDAPLEAPKPLGPNPDGSPATGPSVSASPGPLGTDTTGANASGVDPAEAVTVTDTKVAPSSPTILDMISDKGTQTAEKGALTTALFSLLFPTGGGGAGSAPSISGSSAGGPGGSGSGGGSVAGTATQAAASGQTGSTSGYAPGSPILTSPEGATKYSPWNVESLRTGTG